MRMLLSREFAGLAAAALIFSTVQPTAAGLRIGGMGGLGGGFRGFHSPHPAFLGVHPGQKFIVGDHFRMDKHFRHPEGGFLLGGFGVYAPYAVLGPNVTPFDLGYGYSYSVSVAAPGATAAPSADSVDPEPSGGCLVYKLNYDDQDRYRGVTAMRACR